MSIKSKAALACSGAAIVALVPVLYKDTLHTSEAGLKHIAAVEGCMYCSYGDVIGVNTIGIGATRDLQGHRITKGRRLSNAEIALLFARDVSEAEQCVDEHLAGRHMPQSVYDASVSLVFNVGCAGAMWNAKRHRHTNLYHNANAHLWEYVCGDMGSYIYGGGKVVPGLKARRAKDQALCRGDL